MSPVFLLQLMKELKKGRAFDGWSEGTLSFAPTYKYELNSDTYIGEDPKMGRRTPAWYKYLLVSFPYPLYVLIRWYKHELFCYRCDRVLSFGTGMRLVDYRRSEIKISDHRPVTASYMVEVEVFSHKKLQRALTFTNAQVEEEDLTTDVELNTGLSLPVLEEVSFLLLYSALRTIVRHCWIVKLLYCRWILFAGRVVLGALKHFIAVAEEAASGV